MATAFKTLGQIAPSAGAMTVLYVTPAVTNVTVSSLVMCNQGAATTVRVAVARTAESTLAAYHYIYYDLPIAANDTFIATVGITGAATQEIRCSSQSGLVSFNAFGAEMT